ncbi:hypothetical protein ES332_A01G201100v1 [Gossypium tomentosum]|uniref:Uncharacterized protein n=1 Tax=Gossypium tomentosum TaxID=34277 RepID=A0A5D2RTZ3_GOSTO|nr:hypothetical protein ES332_A01G201100v1 [Gossypium tomentosum]
MPLIYKRFFSKYNRSPFMTQPRRTEGRAPTTRQQGRIWCKWSRCAGGRQ